MVRLNRWAPVARWAADGLAAVTEHARNDPILSDWLGHLDPPSPDASVRDHIDEWRGQLLVAGFGDEFIYDPGHSEPNRYWDPAVTRLWNHHRVVDAFIEIWVMTDDATASVELDELPASASLAALFDTVERIGPRTGAINGWQAPLGPTIDEPT